jgi:hypothetical protein
MSKPKRINPSSARRRPGRRPQVSLPSINPNAAGADIGAREIIVCVPADRAENPVRTFATFTRDLLALSG